MDETKLAELEAVAAAAKQQAEEAGGADESLNQALTEAEAAVESAKKELEAGQQDIDFKKELEREELRQPPKRSEKEKAKFTIEKIFERHPDLREDFEPEYVESDDEDKISALEKKLLRNQVEGIIRQNSKTEDEIKYKMYFYDNRIVKTGNIHEDADNAEWLATKTRTRNAISEMNRRPESPGMASGAGQKPPLNMIPDLPSEDIKKMLQMGLKKTAPDKWEGTKVVVQYNKQTKQWEQSIKTNPSKK